MITDRGRARPPVTSDWWAWHTMVKHLMTNTSEGKVLCDDMHIMLVNADVISQSPARSPSSVASI